ncbi:30S ribosomal protein S12 methylthiotransferase RimO [Barnesiella sp. CU968]|jgi:ribosomal protein S12 methylthiotransferase|uniref:30S ribosomal protein S12 methylthiotransferase RimO n=1 Tax=Barnesiella sp. CU968 TaxID=2780099 RepID=UPI001957441B|nr:30S ribosomal protein S12 methylthiotransferase RimO [Barnesiella sp. CU968]MBJ2198421.1 30S ribosomal protein S12 methylthiotransferase RimO [Muribaculaceae bacterium]MCI9030680.1 30S ribosomal protein S12 methylthiotransferase RimO [Muribaculaceae bacterium]
MKKNRIDIITMGCSKNLIDSERIIRRLHAKGYDAVHDSGNPEGEYVVVNTCGFIADAKEESIEMLLDLAKLKQEGKIGKIVAMGCLTQRYREELTTELPEIDIMLGKFDWGNFIDSLPDLKDTAKPKQWERELTTPPHSAYLKISEGCNRFCAFCAIPLITGRHTSRTIEEILEETESLVAKGVKEFNVIAQDLSSYGIDIYGSHKLAELIDRMAGIKGVEWIRLHYAYPADFPFDILDVMARHENVCKYIDIALQHVSDKVLNNMRRHITKEETISLIAEMRKRVPDIKIRTTLMVGFPGEGEEEFQELLDFVRTQKFDRMGAFAYSEEDDTWAAKNLKDLIPEETKQKRLDLLMEAQMTIYEEKNAEMYGKEVTLLVDETEGDTRICRSQWDSPEVDMNYYVKGSDAKPGDFIRARITGDQLYDFEADAI